MSAIYLDTWWSQGESNPDLLNAIQKLHYINQ
jgi:hypothetical protein